MRLLILILLIVILIVILINNYESFTNNIDNNLNIILPIRDREDDLKIYLKQMIPIFNYQNINYKIFIIEQKQGKKFNKGKISNIGFLEAIKRNNNNKFLFNDIDNYPLGKNIFDFKKEINSFKHLWGIKDTLGGIFIVNKKSFEKVNGYSNEYWGWGGEDDDLQYRCEILGVSIIRKNFINRNNTENKVFDDSKKTSHIKGDYEFINTKIKKKKSYIKDSKSIMKDGINNTSYKILKENLKYNNNPNIIRLLVDI